MPPPLRPSNIIKKIRYSRFDNNCNTYSYLCVYVFCTNGIYTVYILWLLQVAIFAQTELQCTPSSDGISCHPVQKVRG